MFLGNYQKYSHIRCIRYIRFRPTLAVRCYNYHINFWRGICSRFCIVQNLLGWFPLKEEPTLSSKKEPPNLTSFSPPDTWHLTPDTWHLITWYLMSFSPPHLILDVVQPFSKQNLTWYLTSFSPFLSKTCVKRCYGKSGSQNGPVLVLYNFQSKIKRPKKATLTFLVSALDSSHFSQKSKLRSSHFKTWQNSSFLFALSGPPHSIDKAPKDRSTSNPNNQIKPAGLELYV